MPAPPKTIKTDDVLTSDVLRRYSVTDTGLHLAETTVAQLIRLVRFAQDNPASLGPTKLRDVELHTAGDKDFLTVGDFVNLANDASLMQARDLPGDIVPGGKWSIPQSVRIGHLGVEMQQAMLG